jgi:hypothetical protein
MLDAQAHARILSNFDQVCAVAGIQGRFLHGSMAEHCSSDEVDWVRRFRHYREQGCPGLVLEGVSNPDTRCQAIAAAFVRNFVDARVVPVNTLLDSADNGDRLHPTVLLVPNLYISATQKSVPAWRIQVLYDVLLQRSTQNKPSVVYVEDLKMLAQAYGAPFHDFLSAFRRVKD